MVIKCMQEWLKHCPVVSTFSCTDSTSVTRAMVSIEVFDRLLPSSCCSVFVVKCTVCMFNMELEKWGRPGNTYHVT